MDIKPIVTQTLKKAVTHTPTAHIVVDEPNLHPLTSLGDECIGHEIAQGVVFNNVGGEMNVMNSPGYVCQQGGEKLIARGVDFHIVVLERQRKVLIGEKPHQRKLVFGNMEVLLFGKFEHGALGELIHTALTDHALFAYVLTEEEIERNAHHGQEYEHHQPSHGLHRLTVVHQHSCHRGYNHDDIDGKNHPMQVNHTLKLPFYLKPISL